MSITVYNKAKELAEALSGSKELNDVREAEARMLEDTEARRIIDAFQEKQYHMQMIQSQGQALTKAQKDQVEELEKQMVENPLIFDFYKARQNFELILQRVNKIIGESLGSDPECGCDSECGEGPCGCNGCQ
ncbi:MAG: hypothetical protein BWY80_01183 [Firmicutes bacterium ADurb.Bin456]|nr:MAG: hypothetical protein BWY80_01183 [Firmicutes bacterium ADurb.Bin456]